MLTANLITIAKIALIALFVERDFAREEPKMELLVPVETPAEIQKRLDEMKQAAVVRLKTVTSERWPSLFEVFVFVATGLVVAAICHRRSRSRRNLALLLPSHLRHHPNATSWCTCFILKTKRWQFFNHFLEI